MKKLILIIISFTFIYSCNINSENKNNHKKTRITYPVTTWTNNVELVVIDSCEYLFGPWRNATVLTHKGNCKNCKKK